MKIFSAQTNYNLPIYDYQLIWTTLLLLGAGLVMVYSSSVDIAASSKVLNFNSYHYLIRHSIYILIGFIFGYIAFLVPLYFWQRICFSSYRFVKMNLFFLVMCAIQTEVVFDYCQQLFLLHIAGIRYAWFLDNFIIFFCAGFGVLSAFLAV